MKWGEIKPGDVLIPVEGEENAWRTPHLVLEARPAGYDPAFILLVVFCLENGDQRALSFEAEQEHNPLYTVERVR